MQGHLFHHGFVQNPFGVVNRDVKFAWLANVFNRDFTLCDQLETEQHERASNSIPRFRVVMLIASPKKTDSGEGKGGKQDAFSCSNLFAIGVIR